MSSALFSKYLSYKDENIRKQAFESMYSLYKKHINTITELYLSRVKSRVISSKIRNYASSLDSATNNDDASVLVYDTLLKEMNKNLYLNHEYIKLKAKLLGKEKINMYDAYVNTLDAEEKYIEYEEAKNIVLDALSIMGEEYISILKKAFNNNWLDVYEKDNKILGFIGIIDGYIAGIFVKDGMQGNGIGKILIDTCKKDSNELTLNVYEKNRLDLKEIIEDIHSRKPSYGYRRINAKIIQETGWKVSDNLVHKVCKLNNIK